MILRNKIGAVGKMSKMMTTLRENNEVLLQIKSMSPDGKLPRGALLETKNHIEYAAKTFKTLQGLDAPNEKNPKRTNKHKN